MTTATEYYTRKREILNRFERRIEAAPRGRKGEMRAALKAAQWRLGRLQYPSTYRPNGPTESYKLRIGSGLAKKAGIVPDEHGSSWDRGDHISVRVLDAVPANQAGRAPYHDHGRGGLALVEVSRKRVYAKSSKWYPSFTTSIALVGRNEAGTFFAHLVSPRCTTVVGALDWMWSGLADHIVERQGDIALVRAPGPKMPTTLPSGHRVDTAAGQIVHATHSAMRLPGKGERVIVARRASPRASSGTRD